MPAGTKWTVSSSGIRNSGIDKKTATIQIRGQQRVTVRLKVADPVNVTSIDITSPRDSDNTLPTTYSYTDSNNKTHTLKIVWYGTVYVYSASNKNTQITSYPIMLTSTSARVALPSFGARKVEFRLCAAVGTVVDAGGNVLTTTAATTYTVLRNGSVVTTDTPQSTDVIVVAPGQTKPQFQRESGVWTFTLNG